MEKKLSNLINKMYNAGVIITPIENDFSTHYLTKKGGEKLAESKLSLPENGSERMKFLQQAIADGIISKDDIHLKLIAMPEAAGIPGLREDIAHFYADMIKNSGMHIDVLCSLAYAGIGMGTLTAHKLGLPHSIFRKEQPEEDKRLSVISGYPIKNGDTVALCDDAVQAGRTAVNSAGYLRLNGAKVNDAYAFLQYRGNGAENCANNDLTAHTGITEQRLTKWILDNHGRNLSPYTKDLLDRSSNS